eukprot:10812822-Lingulodinium_polyedra.AAC.1
MGRWVWVVRSRGLREWQEHVIALCIHALPGIDSAGAGPRWRPLCRGPRGPVLGRPSPRRAHRE